MNQHFVPRVYLKHFSQKKGNEYFVDVYDKNKNIYFNTNIKNICSEKDFYTLEENNMVARDLLAVEKVYSNCIEPIYLKAYSILTNDSIVKISNFQRAEILIGIFQLYTRNPRLLYNATKNHRLNISKLYKIAKAKGEKGITYCDEDFSFREWEEEIIIRHFTDKVTKYFKEKHIVGIKDFGFHHQYTTFEVSKISDHSQFITSDNPLISTDIITNDEHPLLKSKEFTLSLSPKYALRMFHDNTKDPNTIYREKIPNGSAHLINFSIYNQSSRFLISDKQTFTEYFKIKEIFDCTSLDLKIDAIRQIVTKFPITPDNAENIKILKYYLDKYDIEGTLSKNDEYELFEKIRQDNIADKKEKLRDK